MVQARWSRLGAAVVLFTVLSILAALFYVEDLHLMPRPATARRVLASLGYTAIRITGTHPLGCSDGEPFRTAFEATSPAGKRVYGTVCQGWFEGAAVRVQ